MADAEPKRPYQPSRINPVRRFQVRFAWYDLWVGAYVDHKNAALYVCPLPTLLLTFRWCPHNMAAWPPLPADGRCLRCGKRLLRPTQKAVIERG